MLSREQMNKEHEINCQKGLRRGGQGLKRSLVGPKETHEKESPKLELCVSAVLNVASRSRQDKEVPLRELKASIRVKCIER